MQIFEKYPRLAQKIKRMASTGKTGTPLEWNDFLILLNAALDVANMSEINELKFEIKNLKTENEILEAQIEQIRINCGT